MMTDEIYLVILLACILLSALLSAAETAISALGYLKAKNLHESDQQGAKSLSLWLHHPTRVLTTILLYKNILLISASAMLTMLVAKHVQSYPIAISVGILSFIVMIIAEAIPRAYAKSHSERIAIKAIGFIQLFYYIAWPFVIALTELASRTVKKIGPKAAGQAIITEDELEFLVEVSERSGVLEKLKKKMLSGVFDFDEIKVREIMTPRTDMQALSTNATLEDILAHINEWRYSRIPIYQDTIDNIVGMLLVKDLLPYSLKLQNPGNFNLKQIMRKAVFVPESNFINDVFRDLNATKTHIAIVIDEYGGTAGLVTLEDIIETIVGEIQDEHDEEEQEFRKLGENIYQVSGAATIDDFLEFFQLDEEDITEMYQEDVDTIGGWLTQLIQDMPKVGQTVKIAHLKIEITKIDKHRIRTIKVIDVKPTSAEEAPTQIPILESMN